MSFEQYWETTWMSKYPVSYEKDMAEIIWNDAQKAVEQKKQEQVPALFKPPPQRIGEC
jgi:hypothetical protein